ncbi:NB-ARC domain-containing protein [Streptosporangium sp. NPDC023825]|uniref:NB-ARC domain-containing protein n=1 Tax=Streptosporangium sp. NPDC023825 TaxID=3154909 RepID=UPI003429429D
MPQVLNPGRARTMDEFIAELRLLKAWAGNPSITEITRRVHDLWHHSGRPRSEWPARSTVGNCFQEGRRRPNTDLLLAIVHALVDGDTAALSLWRQALRTVLGEAEAAGRVSVYDRLPEAFTHFTGRSHLMTRAETLSDGGDTGRAVLLEGMAGTGKTALAVRLGHRFRAAGLITGPTLFANLRGSASEGPPADPMAVLETFLRLLGVSGDRIARNADGRITLYRRLLAGTGALVVLDDAADVEQLSPLLPGSPTCRTLITSRRTLPGLSRVARLLVPVLAPDESLDLLRQVAGTGRVDDDLPAAREITDRLGHLPLALSIIGHHMRDHPAWPLSDYYGEPLTVLALEGGVRRSFATSEAKLTEGARQLLRFLALHPLHDVDVHAAAALVDKPTAVTQRHLTALHEAHLLEEAAPGRYRFHNLVRAYAEERMCIDEPASHIRQALNRVLAHYRNMRGSSPPPSLEPQRSATALTPYRHEPRRGPWRSWPAPSRPVPEKTAGSLSIR